MNRRSFIGRLFGAVAAVATGAVGFDALAEEAIPSDAFRDCVWAPIQPTADGYYVLFVHPDQAQQLEALGSMMDSAFASGHLASYRGVKIIEVGGV